MWFLRRMMKISWMAKKSNDTVLNEAHTSRALVKKFGNDKQHSLVM